MQTTNSKVSDAVSQVNAHTIGENPAIAMGNLMLSTSHALANISHNATLAQQQGNAMMQAATVQGVNAILGIGMANIGK